MLMQRFQAKAVHGACQGIRRCASTQPPQNSLDRFFNWLLTKRKTQVMAFVGGNMVMQYIYGEEKNFFRGTFVTGKNPDDLAEFYQAEDLLKIIAIHPILFNFFMNKVETCDEPEEGMELLAEGETQFRVRNLGMDVAFEIIQEEEEDEFGEDRLKYFNRHERFIDNIPLLPDLGLQIEIEVMGKTFSTNLSFQLWDQVWNFGFRALDKDTIEVFHHGEYFSGPWPVRFVVFLHQYYVLWACEKVINGENFGAEDIDAVHEEMANVPLHLFKKFLATARAQKEQSLLELTSAENQDAAAIAQVTETIKKIDSLSLREQASFSLARRPAGSGSIAKSQRVKIIAKDQETQEVLTALGKNAQANVAALHDGIKASDLQFTKSVRISKPVPDNTSETPTMKSIIVRKSVPEGVSVQDVVAEVGAVGKQDAPALAGKLCDALIAPAVDLTEANIANVVEPQVTAVTPEVAEKSDTHVLDETRLSGQVATTSSSKMTPQQTDTNIANAVDLPATAVKPEVVKKSDQAEAKVADVVEVPATAVTAEVAKKVASTSPSEMTLEEAKAIVYAVELPATRLSEKVAPTCAEITPEQAKANVADAVAMPPEVPKRTDTYAPNETKMSGKVALSCPSRMTSDQRDLVEMIMRQAATMGRNIEIQLSPPSP